MTARLASLSKGAQVALVAAALLLVAVIGYFALIGPKRSTANDLKKQTAAVQAQIAANRSSAFTQALPAVRSASVFRLAMAMPNQLQTPDVILQLNALAADSGISFDQIQPTPISASATPTTGATDPFAAEPIQVKFTGNFYDLLTFLQRLRNLVRVENGKLYTAGRLFDVSQIQFCSVAASQGCPTTTTNQKAPSTFPLVQAVLTINAFVPQTPQVAPTTPGSTDTTGTTTTSTTTTTTSNSTSAAPSTSGGTS